MRITRIAARGILSFEDLDLPFDKRLTVIVGPNGSGKSNLGKILELGRRAVESADRTSPQLEEMLATFLAGRRSELPADGLEARVGFELNNVFEQSLLVAFVQASAAAALVGNNVGFDSTTIDGWVDRQISLKRLSPLFHGDIVASHRGTPDSQWQVAIEFDIPSRGRRRQKYRWVLRGPLADSIVAVDDLHTPNLFGQQLADRLRGRSQPQQGPPAAPGGVFALSRLLPRARTNVFCSLDLGRTPPLQASRKFAEMIGISPLGEPEPIHHFGFGRVIATVLRLGLIQTSDTRLIPGQSFSWQTTGQQLRRGAEGNLAEMLLLLKNAPSSQRGRYDEVRRRFWEFTNGRQMDVVATAVSPPASADGGDTQGLYLKPQVFVSIDPTDVNDLGPIAQVPIEFAGAGASEALLLASVLGSQATDTVALDEPAVALSPTLQRRVKNHLQASAAQFIIITHSPYFLPLGIDQKNVRIVRLERETGSATHPWVIDSALLGKLSKKLVAKGNELIPFAWRVVLCEGETDVEAVRLLAERIHLDLDFLNIAVIDCGSRDNLPDYIAFCGALGIASLALMDGDSSKAARDESVRGNAQAVRDAVKKAPRGKLVEFSEDIETTLGVKKQRVSLVPAAIAMLDLEGTCPDEIVDLIMMLRQLAQ
jgi:energy-coupling factor transporter ATP-binding protein EcfA2